MHNIQENPGNVLFNMFSYEKQVLLKDQTQIFGHLYRVFLHQSAISTLGSICMTFGGQILTTMTRAWSVVGLQAAWLFIRFKWN